MVFQKFHFQAIIYNFDTYTHIKKMMRFFFAVIENWKNRYYENYGRIMEWNFYLRFSFRSVYISYLVDITVLLAWCVIIQNFGKSLLGSTLILIHIIEWKCQFIDNQLEKYENEKVQTHTERSREKGTGTHAINKWYNIQVFSNNFYCSGFCNGNIINVFYENWDTPNPTWVAFLPVKPMRWRRRRRPFSRSIVTFRVLVFCLSFFFSFSFSVCSTNSAETCWFHTTFFFLSMLLLMLTRLKYFGFPSDTESNIISLSHNRIKSNKLFSNMSFEHMLS